MLLLTSTSDVLRVVTGSAANSIDVHASYVDISGSTVTHFHNPRALTFDEFVGEHAFARDAASATVVRSAEVILLDRYREDEEIMLFAAGWR